MVDGEMKQHGIKTVKEGTKERTSHNKRKREVRGKHTEEMENEE